MAADAEKLAAQGDRIKQLRLRRRTTDTGKRLTQEAVADAVGVTTRAYQEWEAGRGDMKPENVQALADFYGVNPDFIEYGSVAPDGQTETPDPFATNGDGDVLARLAGIEEQLVRLAERLEVGIGNQEKMLDLIGKRQNSNLEKVQESFDQIRSLLATATDPPPATPSTGQDRSRRRAA